jgi:hypothetical protein
MATPDEILPNKDRGPGQVMGADAAACEFGYVAIALLL